MRKIFKVLLIIITLVIVGFVLKKKEGAVIDEGYPQVSGPPVLKLVWPEDLDPKDATRYTPYGIWESTTKTEEGVAYEPANEMQFYMITDASDFLAVAPGIVTQNNLYNGSIGLVSVKYGENYVVTYYHILPDKKLKPGTKIDTGEVLGKMEKAVNPHHGEETWWEISVSTNFDGLYRTHPPYDFFDQESKDLLDEIAENSRELRPGEIREKPYWTVSEGCSWIKYTGVPEWWDSNRFHGFSQKESEEEFIKNLNPNWKVADNMGNVIGPTDICD